MKKGFFGEEFPFQKNSTTHRLTKGLLSSALLNIVTRTHRALDISIMTAEKLTLKSNSMCCRLQGVDCHCGAWKRSLEASETASLTYVGSIYCTISVKMWNWNWCSDACCKEDVSSCKKHSSQSRAEKSCSTEKKCQKSNVMNELLRHVALDLGGGFRRKQTRYIFTFKSYDSTSESILMTFRFHDELKNLFAVTTSSSFHAQCS